MSYLIQVPDRRGLSYLNVFKIQAFGCSVFDDISNIVTV